MKYLKRFEEINITNLFNSRKKYDIKLSKRNDLLADIFRKLKKDGYLFKRDRSPIQGKNYSTGVFWDENQIPSSYKLWSYTLITLDQVPPLFKDLLQGNFELICGMDEFKIRPFISSSIINEYNNSDLKKDFPNMEFDPLDPDVVEKIKNFIDQFELKVLK